MRKLVFLLCIFLGMSYLSCNALEGEKLFTYFKLKKDQVLQRLGNNYSIVYTGAEGSYEGYHYPKIGITIVFEDNETIRFIECDNKVNFNGAKAGMSFAKIQQKLGKREIQETWYETEDNKAYKIEYVYGDLIVEFLSFNKDGKDSVVTIYKNPSSNN